MFRLYVIKSVATVNEFRVILDHPSYLLGYWNGSLKIIVTALCTRLLKSQSGNFLTDPLTRLLKSRSGNCVPDHRTCITKPALVSTFRFFITSQQSTDTESPDNYMSANWNHTNNNSIKQWEKQRRLILLHEFLVDY